MVYHHVAELDSDPWSLSVTRRHFAEHVEILRRHFRPVALRQLAQALDDGDIPRRSVAITFDDGYADNLYHARYFLERHSVPATVFVVTGAIGQRREFWWDELDALFLRPGRLPTELELAVSGQAHSWTLGEAASYTKEDARAHRHWRAWEDAPSPRHALYHSLWDLLHSMLAGEREEVLDALREWAGVEPLCRPTHRVLDRSEALALAEGGPIELGAHTVTHPSLSALPVAAQREEIRKSKTYLEEESGSPVTSFSYPFGKRCDYTSETIALVQEAGFTCACSSFPGAVERTVDPFQLPRVQAPDIDGRSFGKWLRTLYGDW
jgi:peptidoglycan/xylan/chitin deacetylase (PgdA/CDA1 family)